MPTAPDRRLLEIEAELAKFPPDLLRLRFGRTTYVSRIAASRVSTVRLTGSTFCVKTATWVLSGADRTDANGRLAISLNQRVCSPDVPSPALFGIAPLVATPISDKPAILTVTYETRPSALLSENVPIAIWSTESHPGLWEAENWLYEAEKPLDIDVTVHSWAPDGTAAASVDFNWVCSVQAARFVLIGG